MLPPFRPHALIRGGHAQTIAGCYFPGVNLAERARRHVVELPDGDRVVLHEDEPNLHALENGSSANRGKVVLLVHGLGGSHRSGYMQRCTIKLTARGIRVFRMDLRGCGAGLGLARYPAHAGRSEDVGAALEHVIREDPSASIHAVGFSMGANLVLKLAGEMADLAPPQLASVMAVAPPIDLLACSRNLQRGLNRVYDRNFVIGLLRAAALRRRHTPLDLDRALQPPPRKLVEFDDRFTAPLAGFASAEEYYIGASSGPLLKQIAVPALIVTAADDPIVPVDPFERACYAPQTHLAIAAGGGHLGFIGRRGLDPDRRWLDWRVLEWVESQVRRQVAGAESSKPQKIAFGAVASAASATATTAISST